MKTYINKHQTGIHFNRNGFTLIEILLAMMITTILAAGINASYRQVSNVSSYIEEQREIYQQGTDLIAVLRNELSGLYLPATEDAKSNQVSFTLSTTGNSQELAFFTMTPAWNQMPACGKMAKVIYSFQKTNDTAQLSRKEQLFSGEKPIAKESSLVIDEKLTEFVIEVTDTFDTTENSWQKTYSSKSSVPKAVKIQIRYRNDKKGTYTNFNTTLAIRCGN